MSNIICPDFVTFVNRTRKQIKYDNADSQHKATYTG